MNNSDEQFMENKFERNEFVIVIKGKNEIHVMGTEQIC